MGEQRIVWVGPVPPPRHGASSITLRYLQRAGRSWCIDVVATQGSRRRSLYHTARVLAHLRAVVRVVKRPHAVYISLAGGRGLLYQLPVLAAARVARVNVVLHHHSYSYITERNRLMFLAHRVAGPGVRHIFLSHAMRDVFGELYRTPVESTRIVSNACFINRIEAVPPRAATTLSIVHVSNLSVAKGSGRVIDVWEEMLKRGHEVTLALIGGCSDPALSARIESAARAEPHRFRWLGECDEVAVIEELDRSHWFVFPSEYVNEAEPLVVLEALSRGLPVVATSRGALGEVLPAPWLSRASSTEALADLLEARSGPGRWPAEARKALGCFDARVESSDDPLECLVW